MSGWNPPPPPGGGGMPPGGYGTPPPPPGGGYGTPPPPGGGGYGTPPPPGGYGPPPGGPYGQPGPFGPPPMKPKSNAGLIIGLVAGAVVLVVVVVVGALVVIGGGGKEYTISPPATVAGHTRDSTVESQMSKSMAPLETQMRSVAKGKIDSFVTAFYKKNTGTSGSSLMPNGVVFVGGTGDLGDPGKFIEGFKEAGGKQGSSVVDVEPGPHGGKAACGTVRASGTSITQCAWATSSTFGVIVPMGSSATTSTAEGTMRLFRADVEQEK